MLNIQFYGAHMSQLEFEHSQAKLTEIAQYILERALSLGASSAQVEMNESIETEVAVLNGDIDSFETSYDSSLGLTVYIGHNRGSVGISQVPPHNIDGIIKQALNIAQYTQPDPHNGLADPSLMCQGFSDKLALFNPLSLNNQEIINKAKNIEAIALNLDSHITQSDGAAISLAKYNFVLANSNGLNLGYPTTRYGASLSIIGHSQEGMQTDYWYDSSRDFNELIPNNQLATTAAKRLLRRLNKGQIAAGKYPVIFEAPIAKSLIGNFLGAISGNNLYRQLSFLTNSLNTQVFPSWVNISEDPFVVKGLASCYFDNEGVQVAPRKLVAEGKVNGYLLSSYSARKLGLQTTGNAGGNHNIIVQANFSGDIYQLARTMGTGLIIIETIGHGVNMVTGDYSVGASGLWVEHGEVQFFVDNLTIAGNLKQIYHNIQYISDDINHGSILCGSILVDGINVSA
jgi:PmbA protein